VSAFPKTIVVLNELPWKLITDDVSIAFDPFDTMIVGWATVTSKLRLSVVTWPEMRIVRFDDAVRVPLAYEKPTVPYEFATSMVS